MGATGSSNRAPSPSPPSRGRNEEAFAYGAEESWCPEYANENIRQRTRANAFDVGEEPRSQVKYKTNIYRAGRLAHVSHAFYTTDIILILAGTESLRDLQRRRMVESKTIGSEFVELAISSPRNFGERRFFIP